MPASESEKLDDLMGDLIEVAEFDSGKRELKLERLRPFRPWAKPATAICDEAAQKRIRVEITPSPTCPW